MASLLDFLGQGGGLLGNFGNGGFKYNEPDEAQNARDAAAMRLSAAARRRLPISGMDPQGPAIGMQDPFNFLLSPSNVAGASPMLPPQGPAEQPQAAPAMQPPNGMPVSLGPSMNAPAASPSPLPSFQPPIAPQQEPSFGSRISDFLANNPATLMALGGGIARHGVGGFADAAPIAFHERQQAITNQNQLAAAKAIAQGLIAKGYKPEMAVAIAQAASGNKEVAQAILPEALGTRKPSGTMKIGNLEVPYLIGDSGHANLVLPGSDSAGGGNVNSLDDLVKYQQGLEAASTKNKAIAEAVGKSQGETSQALPDALAASDQAIKEIDELKNHPGKKYATGMLAGVPAIPGTQQADYVARLNQLKGATFIQAFQALKGSGVRITQTEAIRAEHAIARLDRGADIDSALTDLGDIIRGVRERSGIKAGVGPTPAPAAVQSGGWMPVPGGRIREVK